MGLEYGRTLQASIQTGGTLTVVGFRLSLCSLHNVTLFTFYFLQGRLLRTRLWPVVIIKYTLKITIRDSIHFLSLNNSAVYSTDSLKLYVGTRCVRITYGVS